MPKYLIVHMADAEDAEQADMLANKLALPFTPKDKQPELVMVSEIDDPEDDIACALTFLPDGDSEVQDGEVILRTGIMKEQ